MRSSAVATSLLLASGLAGIAFWRPSPVLGHTAASTINRQSAAQYLDAREIWWQNWPHAQKDNGTICISCHTQVPYAMVRPTLQRDLGENARNPADRTMMDSVEKRVTHWPDMATFYSDAKSGPGKTAESRATEAVLNAIILASADAAQGHLRPVTRTAFDEAWQLQETTGDLAGVWKWQNFHLGPWEGNESGYQGAALFLLAALNAPDNYAAEPAVRPRIDQLHTYLQQHYAAQPVLNQLYILWASPKAPGLMTPAQRKALLAAHDGQQQADGGWLTMALDEVPRKDDSPEPTVSDGYATGLTVLALEESVTSRRDPMLQRGLAWLTTHQQKDGTWTALSINKERDLDSDPALFMTDAATAYAVLALDKAR